MTEEHDKLKSEIDCLKAENERLRAQLGRPEAQGLQGFCLQQKGQYWYAVKRIAGKLHWVYLGKSPQGAEEKISAHLRENEPREVLPNMLGKTGTDGMARLKVNLEEMRSELERLESLVSDEVQTLKQSYPTITPFLEAELDQIRQTISTMEHKRQEANALLDETSQEPAQSAPEP